MFRTLCTYICSWSEIRGRLSFAFGFIYWFCTGTTFLFHKPQSIYFWSVFAAACTPTTLRVCVCVHLSRSAYMTYETNNSLWLKLCSAAHIISPRQRARAQRSLTMCVFVSCCLSSDRSLLRSHTQLNTLLMVSVLTSSFHANTPKLKIRPSDIQRKIFSVNVTKMIVFYLVIVS